MLQLANDQEQHSQQETIVFEDDEVPSYLVIQSNRGQAVIVVEAQRSSR